MESKRGEKTQNSSESRNPVVITAKGKTDEEVLENLKQKAMKDLIPRLVPIQTVTGRIKIGPIDPLAECQCDCECGKKGSGSGGGSGQ